MSLFLCICNYDELYIIILDKPVLLRKKCGYTKSGIFNKQGICDTIPMDGAISNFWCICTSAVIPSSCEYF